MPHVCRIGHSTRDARAHALPPCRTRTSVAYCSILRRMHGVQVGGRLAVTLTFGIGREVHVYPRRSIVELLQKGEDDYDDEVAPSLRLDASYITMMHSEVTTYMIVRVAGSLSVGDGWSHQESLHEVGFVPAWGIIVLQSQILIRAYLSASLPICRTSHT